MNSKNHIQKWFAPERPRSNEAALSLRSRRSGTKFAVSLLAKLLIKYQRLSRGFFWNEVFLPLVRDIGEFTE